VTLNDEIGGARYRLTPLLNGNAYILANRGKVTSEDFGRRLLGCYRRLLCETGK
jgi:hypothetical protein